MNEVDRYAHKKVYRRVYQALQSYTRRRKSLHYMGAQVQARMTLRTYRGVLEKMICRYARKVTLRQLQNDFREKKLRQLERESFLTWCLKYRNLKIRERHISKTHNLLIKKQMFSIWLFLSQQQCQHNQKFDRMIFQTTTHVKSRVFRGWFQYAKDRIENRKLKAVSSFFFISKVLRRTILALRMHAIQSRFNNANTRKIAPRLFKTCFEALKTNWQTQRNIRMFRQRSEKRRGAQALQTWLNVAN